MLNKFFLLSLFIGLFTANSIAQTTITMKKQGGIYVVPCKVNGLDLRFIFDTGASDVSISLTEALFMLKNGYLKENDIGEKVYYSIANGDVESGTKIILREIEFAGLKLYNVEASIVHNSEAPLLLGQSAISKLGKFQIDPNNNTLTVFSGSGSYNYSDYAYKPQTNSQASSYIAATLSPIPEYYLKRPIYSETVKVFTYSPILGYPDQLNYKPIGKAENGIVTIIRRENPMYYYVKSGNTTGYMSVMWIKENQQSN